MTVTSAVQANIRRTLEEPPIVINIALPVHTSVIPPTQANTTIKTIVPCAVWANIRRTLDEPPIASFAALVHTSEIPIMQPNTTKKTIVKFAVPVNIQRTPEEPPTAIRIAVPARISVILPIEATTTKQEIA